VLIGGSVDEYVVKTATLRLKHNYPASEPALVADVDIELILEVMKRNYLDVGTWLNVIGHVQHRQEDGVSVQAVAIWDAGNIDLVAYQRAVEKRKQAS
jgi:hypothetical protein